MSMIDALEPCPDCGSMNHKACVMVHLTMHRRMFAVLTQAVAMAMLVAEEHHNANLQESLNDLADVLNLHLQIPHSEPLDE